MKTAVEWLITEVKKFNTVITREYILMLFEQAKAIEKEQIKESFKDGVHEGVLTDINYLKCDNEAEYYYNETYNK